MHDERELVMETERCVDLTPGADDVFAGFRMPNTVQASALDSRPGVVQERDDEDQFELKDEAGRTTWKGRMLQYSRMDGQIDQTATQTDHDEYDELRAEVPVRATVPSMSAKERVLARRAQQKLQEEVERNIALDTARRRYFSERQEAVQMQRKQYRGREGLAQSLHLHTDRIDATLNQVHLLTEPLTPQKLRFVHAHRWDR
jgi:hypothetical protein